MSKNRIYSVQEFDILLEECKDAQSVSAVVLVAMGQHSQKNLSQYAFAGLLSKASDKIYSFK